MALGWVWWRTWSPLVVGVPRHFAWQAGHLVTSTFHLRGKGSTWAHPPWFRVAGIALMALGSALSHTTLSHTTPLHATLSQTILSHTHNSFICTVQLWHTELFHTHLLCLSFPRPAPTSVSNYWKKLTCGVILSFNCLCVCMCLLPSSLYLIRNLGTGAGAALFIPRSCVLNSKV